MKKDKRKLMTAILAGILALVMLLGMIAMIGPVVASATESDRSSSEIKEDLDKLKADEQKIQDEINGLQEQMSGNMDDMKEVVKRKNIIDQETFLLMEQVTNINAQIAAFNALIADKQLEVEQAQADLKAMQQRNKLRIRAMEKNSYTSYWSVVFQAESFLDMLDRMKMIQEIQESDKRMISDFHTAAEAVRAAKADLEKEKLAMEQTKKELAETQKALDEKRAEADALLTQLVAKGDEYKALVEEAEAKKAELGEKIDEVQSEYEEAQAYEKWLEDQRNQEANNAQQGAAGGNGGTANQTPSGKWLVPVNYVYLSSPFGYRWHPVYGTYTFHYGVDLAAAQGTPIIATRSGVVSVATYDSAAGYYVNINHGDGFVSRYLHMTHYIVSPGQRVEAGQVIGYCGSTGASTGPHLHFGIYLNGSAVNPADYIAI